MATLPLYHVAILGCGVIGLSTALAILEDQNGQGGKTVVTIVAKEVPDLAGTTKKHSAEYASVWAGGHHVSDAKSERELRHDKITFERMSTLARTRPWSKAAGGIVYCSFTCCTNAVTEPLVWVHQTELFETAASPLPTASPPYKEILDWYPDFKPLPSSSLASGIGWGCTFSTIDINVPVYHAWMLHRFLDLDGRLIVSEAKSLQQAIQIASSPSSSTICKHPTNWTSPQKPDVLVASPGLGARFIDGIKDTAIQPHRGQVVVVYAPWLSSNSPAWAEQPRYTLPGYSVVRPQGGREVYVIPRGDGTVVCGGTRIVDDWDPHPREETTRRILERCLALVPQLVDPRKWTGLTKPRVEDVQLVGVNVGLRPARRGGVRLERAREDVDGVKVIYNYGYGGAGYQASWGAALEAKAVSTRKRGRESLGSNHRY
ncbi:related to D-amino acid oxidase [Sporisorium scitamineum]|uniref:Related to D-amino acid oxidase n=1 Tax=Sporisorium scitamineum TaxID=49012 RepID=A0A127ZEA0_9BASI|nr:related to D-amino acid oxidase [Sporisorium scitamineum]